jgi:hypothetical protein
MQMSPEFEQLLRQNTVSDEHIRSVIQTALTLGELRVPVRERAPIFFAGGTNMCPNSDFAFSELAATVPGTLPGDAGATNNECHRMFRQLVDTAISATRVNAAEATAEAPQWDKVAGVIALGSTNSAANYDVAIKFTNNWLVNNRKWYVRVAVALADDTPLPDDCKLFAGFWIKRNTPSEDWANGSGFTIEHKILGVPGVRNFKYKCIAKTDTGFTVESAVLDVLDIPATLGPLPGDNKVQITYPGGVGFIEFKLYREDVATGQVDLIAWDRNTTNLRAFDTGQSLRLEPGGLPTVPPSEYRAFEEIPIDAVSITTQKTFHDFIIRIPAGVDQSDLIAEGTYLRIGVLGETAINRQVLIDTVWASETYNVWSPSPFDNYQSPPSTTMTTAPPTGGGNPGTPPTGGGPTCVWDEHDILLDDLDIKESYFIKLKDCQDLDVCNSSVPEDPNLVSEFIDGEPSQHFLVTFTNGLIVRCSASHRFLRTLKDRSGVLSGALRKGHKLSGGRLVDGQIERFSVEVHDVRIVNEPIKVRAPKMAPGSINRRYSVGNRVTGFFVDCSNTKPIEPQF